jgi:uncharacterized paraquat-inducible protein A
LKLAWGYLGLKGLKNYRYIHFGRTYLLVGSQKWTVMALVDCKECQKKVSDEALHCPRCGAPVTYVDKKRLVEIYAGLFFFIFFAILISLFMYNPN